MSFLGSGGLEVQDLCVDEGRQVYLVQVPGAFLVVKYFDSCRLEGNTAQVTHAIALFLYSRTHERMGFQRMYVFQTRCNDSLITGLDSELSI